MDRRIVKGGRRRMDRVGGVGRMEYVGGEGGIESF